MLIIRLSRCTTLWHGCQAVSLSAHLQISHASVVWLTSGVHSFAAIGIPAMDELYPSRRDIWCAIP